MQQPNRSNYHGLQNGLTKEMEEILKSINLSWLFAKDLMHGVSDEQTPWQLFEPTKFIYSFFVFNMLYEIDWEKSISRRVINDEDRGPAREKIKGLLGFIYQHGVPKSFRAYYVGYDPDLSIVRTSSQIEGDKNINRTGGHFANRGNKNYLDNFKFAITALEKDELGIEAHYSLLMFCYQIRNNIFHGQKKATVMIKSGQRTRLLSYAHIILATVEMFFEVLKTNYNYRPANRDEFQENISTKSV